MSTLTLFIVIALYEREEITSVGCFLRYFFLVLPYVVVLLTHDTLISVYFFFIVIYVRIRESKYHISCFFFLLNIVGDLFQNINFDNNIEEMATAKSYKDEARPFGTESKF